MLRFKLVVIGTTALTGLLNFGLEHRWRDRRTKRHKRWRRALLALLIASSTSAIVVVVVDDNQSATREADAQSDRETLVQGIAKLHTTLEPFMELASARHPSLDPDAALTSLHREIISLQHTALTRIIHDPAQHT